jgi:predicted PhzF superfamily epimerase YddE/YHI9
MALIQYQVDAFAERPFEGNPAAVVPLALWLDDALMQAIAAENNLSETAFLVPGESAWQLRWFTPLNEIDLCGHATLASAHVLFHERGVDQETLHFDTRSGRLSVRRRGEALEMDFPRWNVRPLAQDPGLGTALGAPPVEVLETDACLVAVYAEETQVATLAPDMAAVAALHPHGVLVTAPGTCHDFVSRFFAPAMGVPEDPVTGSTHCALTPFWSGRLGRTVLNARQLSRRGGTLECELAGERVLLRGRAVTVIESTLRL